MYRFALRPRWLLSHLFVIVLVVTMINLGFWQLRRLDERRDRNDVIAERTEEPPVRLADLDPGAAPDVLRYRTAVGEGTYLADRTVLVDNRSMDGRPGAWVVTPFVPGSGRSTVLVNRGFVPFGEANQVEVTEPPDPAAVSGRLAAGAGRSCGSTDSNQTGIVRRYACLDLDAMAADLDLDLARVVLMLDDASSIEDGGPTPVPPPEPGDGPHLSYAVQWFIFSTLGIIGYPLILRRNARHRAVPATEAPDAAQTSDALQVRQFSP